jgi:diguanylate cyclase (GGDEF)-like protein
METSGCEPSGDDLQLELIQRIGRVGYWEFNTALQAMYLPPTSLDLLRTLAGTSRPASLFDVLSDTERRRLQKTLEHAAEQQLEFSLEVKVDNKAVEHAAMVIRGAPLKTAPNALMFAGTFQDITREKRVQAEREEVITQLQSLLDVLPQGVSVIDKELRLVLWNRRFHEILDFPQRLVYRYARFEDFIRYNAERGEYGPGDPESKVQAQVVLAQKFEPHRFERHLTGGGTIQVEGFPFKFGGAISGFVTIYTDISDGKKTEEQLIRQRDVMKTIIDNFPGAISLFDADLKMAACNEQFKTLLELPAHLFDKEVVHFEDFIRFNANRGEYGPGDPEELTGQITERARNFTAHRIERARPGGQWLEIRGTPIPSGGFVTSYIDITERKKAEERIRVLALQDTLTGLPNRLNLNDQVEQALERAAGAKREFAIMFLDLDGFKKVNDSHGHDMGDVLLIHVAQVLKKAVRETDVVARLGGDEFVVLLHDVTGEGMIAAVAHKIVHSISEPCQLEGVQIKIGASIGIAIYPRDGTSRETLLKVSDHAMYLAKSSGKGNYRFNVQCAP